MPEVLDQGALANLLEMVGGDPDFVDELVDTFLGDVPQQLAELRAAVASGIAADAVRPAHTLKGTAGTIGTAGTHRSSRSVSGRTGVVARLVRRVRAPEWQAGRRGQQEYGERRLQRWLHRGLQAPACRGQRLARAVGPSCGNERAFRTNPGCKRCGLPKRALKGCCRCFTPPAPLTIVIPGWRGLRIP